MSIVLPTFTARELLTAAKLNSVNSAITAKFNGGITQADMAWPFPVGGNIDMRWFGFLNLPRFWKFYNINDRDSTTTTVADVYAAVSAEGGGVIVVPPDTTISLNNITVAANVATVGANWTSVIAATAVNNPTFLCTAGASNIWFVNLKFDGDASAGATACAIKVQGNFGTKIQNCLFEDWVHDAVILTNTGSVGLAANDTEISSCSFNSAGVGSSGAHVSIVDVDGLLVKDCFFGTMINGSIVAQIASNSQLARDITIESCFFEFGDEQLTLTAIYFDKTSATLSDSQGGLKIVDCDFDGTGEDSFCSIDIQDWQDFVIDDCTFHDCISGIPAVRARNCQNFKIDVDIWDWTVGDGIVIGTQGNDTTFASRTEVQCFDFSVTSRQRNIGKAGLIITGACKRFIVNANRIADCSQVTTATYSGIEYWNTGTSTDSGGSVISNNSSQNLDAVAPVQRNGLETWSGLGSGGGSTQNTVIGSVGASNLIVIGNNLPGMVSNAAASDFFTDGANVRFIGNLDDIT